MTETGGEAAVTAEAAAGAEAGTAGTGDDVTDGLHSLMLATLHFGPLRSFMACRYTAFCKVGYNSTRKLCFQTATT